MSAGHSGARAPWRQRLDYAAFRNRSGMAPGDKLIQLPLQRPEIGDLLADLGQMFLGDCVHRLTGSRLVVGEVKQRADLIE